MRNTGDRARWAAARVLAVAMLGMLGACQPAAVPARPVTVDTVVMLVAGDELNVTAKAIDWGDPRQSGTRQVTLNLREDQPSDGTVVLDDAGAAELRQRVAGSADSAVIASPRVVVMEGQQASVSVADEPRVPAVPSITLEFRPRLEVYELVALAMKLQVKTGDEPTTMKAKLTSKPGQWVLLTGPRVPGTPNAAAPTTRRVILLVRTGVGS